MEFMRVPKFKAQTPPDAGRTPKTGANYYDMTIKDGSRVFAFDSNNEKRYVKTLLDEMKGWRRSHWDLAADLLEVFLAHKGGNKYDLFDLSASSSVVASDSKFTSHVRSELDRIGRTKGNGTHTLADEPMARIDWAGDYGYDSNLGYAYGGAGVSVVSGTLDVDNTSLKGNSFNTTVRVTDTYSFVDIPWYDQYRRVAEAYDAAWHLEQNGNYTKFRNVMDVVVKR